jgi:small redox-active disulfide protein 2
MQIKILGPGCSRCQQLEQMAKDTIKELAIDASLSEVRDIKEIMKYPILTTPGLVINEELVCSGRIPTKAEITSFITTALTKESKKITL